MRVLAARPGRLLICFFLLVLGCVRQVGRPNLGISCKGQMVAVQIGIDILVLVHSSKLQ